MVCFYVVNVTGMEPPPSRSPINTPLDAHGITLLHQAALRGERDEVVRLLEAEVSVHVQTVAQWTPLHCAVFNDHAGIAELLLNHGADVNHIRGDGLTALHMAVSRQNKDMVQLLLRYGAQVDLSVRNQTHDESVLHFAARHPSCEILQLLLPCSQDIGRMSGTLKESPLHAAADRGYVNNVKALLNAQGNCDLQRTDGSTALHLAATHGHTDVVALLLARGAFVNTRNDYRATNETPLDCAVLNQHKECLAPLLRYGAEFNKTDEKILKMIREVFDSTPLLLNVILDDQSGVKGLTDILLTNNNLSIDQCQALVYEALLFAVAQNRMVLAELLLNVLVKREWLSEASLRAVLDHSVLVNRYDCTRVLLKFMKEKKLIKEDTAHAISAALYNAGQSGEGNIDLRTQVHALLFPQSYHLMNNALRNVRSLYDRMSPPARWGVVAFAVFGVGLLARGKR
jgi:ankyrin repeat protein